MRNNAMPIEQGNIVFYCSTAVIDRIRMERMEGAEPYSDEFGAALDAVGGMFYFVVAYNGDYCVVPAKVVDDLKFPSGDRTPMVDMCIEDYIFSIENNE